MRDDIRPFLDAYTDWGFNVMPLEPKGKRPSIPSWLVYQNRPSTADERGLWWNVGEANIAVVTGEISGNLAVLDCDDMGTAALFAHYLPRTLTVRTGKGCHYYYRVTEPLPTVAFTLNGRKHHVKAHGGYVVAPPSVHPDGPVYRIERNMEPTTIEPERMREALRAVGAVSGATSDRQERPAGWVSELLETHIAEGERHDAFTRLAGYLSTRLHMDETCAVLRLWMEANVDGYERMPEYINPETQVRAWYQQPS